MDWRGETSRIGYGEGGKTKQRVAAEFPGMLRKMLNAEERTRKCSWALIPQVFLDSVSNHIIRIIHAIADGQPRGQPNAASRNLFVAMLNHPEGRNDGGSWIASPGGGQPDFIDSRVYVPFDIDRGQPGSASTSMVIPPGAATVPAASAPDVASMPSVSPTDLDVQRAGEVASAAPVPHDEDSDVDIEGRDIPLEAPPEETMEPGQPEPPRSPTSDAGAGSPRTVAAGAAFSLGGFGIAPAGTGVGTAEVPSVAPSGAPSETAFPVSVLASDSFVGAAAAAVSKAAAAASGPADVEAIGDAADLETALRVGQQRRPWVDVSSDSDAGDVTLTFADPTAPGASRRAGQPPSPAKKAAAAGQREPSWQPALQPRLSREEVRQRIEHAFGPCFPPALARAAARSSSVPPSQTAPTATEELGSAVQAIPLAAPPQRPAGAADVPSPGSAPTLGSQHASPAGLLAAPAAQTWTAPGEGGIFWASAPTQPGEVRFPFTDIRQKARPSAPKTPPKPRPAPKPTMGEPIVGPAVVESSGTASASAASGSAEGPAAADRTARAASRPPAGQRGQPRASSPQYFRWGGTHGYHLSVGDIPPSWTVQEIWERLYRDSTESQAAGGVDFYVDIQKVTLKHGAAASGAGYCVITFRQLETCRAAYEACRQWYTIDYHAGAGRPWKWLQVRYMDERR